MQAHAGVPTRNSRTNRCKGCWRMSWKSELFACRWSRSIQEIRGTFLDKCKSEVTFIGVCFSFWWPLTHVDHIWTRLTINAIRRAWSRMDGSLSTGEWSPNDAEGVLCSFRQIIFSDIEKLVSVKTLSFTLIKILECEMTAIDYSRHFRCRTLLKNPSLSERDRVVASWQGFQ
jgi:hypothetical protein